MAREEKMAALTRLLTQHPKGLTARDAAMGLHIPLRTARRYLAALHTSGQASRAPTYDGIPPVFGWVYKRRAA